MNIRYIWSELIRRPGRAIAGMISIAIGVVLFTSLQSYASAYKRAARTPLSEIGADIVVQREGTRPEQFEGVVFPHSAGSIHANEVQKMKHIPGVEDVGEALFFWSFERNGRFLVGLGIDPAQSVGPGRLKAGVQIGRFLEPGDAGVTVADASYAEQNRLKLGDKISISEQSFTIVGTVDTSRAGQVANANLYIPLVDARKLALQSPNVKKVHQFQASDDNVVFIRANPNAAPDVAKYIELMIGESAIVTTPKSFDEVLGVTFMLIDRFGLLVAGVGLVVAIVGLLRTVLANLWERKLDIALMRAVGWRKREVMTQLSIETVVLSAMGGVEENR